MSDALLYVGASRAVTGLTVIGPTALAARLGLTDWALDGYVTVVKAV